MVKVKEKVPDLCPLLVNASAHWSQLKNSSSFPSSIQEQNFV